MQSSVALATMALIMGTLTSQAAANVIGFDFGSTFFKITLVQPGNPFQIVENTTSKRKTDSQFTITKEQRLFGADSFIGTTRYPKTTFADVASLFAEPYSEETVNKLKLDHFVLNDFVEDERGMIAVQTFSIDEKALKADEDAKETYYSEELAAQILSYGKGLAERQADGNGRVKDAVITVPSHYNQERRRMLLDAADLAGLNVIQLVHENTAASVMYGIDRLDTEEPLNVLIYNMGGRDTEVSVVRYSAITDAKNKTNEHVEVLGEGNDPTLGGKAFDDILVTILADRFNGLKERQGKADVRENGRAMKRLYKEARNIKDILSANKVVNVKVPELLDYVTLAFELTRDDYEAACSGLFDRVKGPIMDALDQAGLSPEDINQVEILGGGIRVPRVQAILKEIMLEKELNVHLNGDEATSFGAAFIASNSSAAFKVRKVYLTTHPRYDIRVKISPLDPEVAEAKRQAASESSADSGEDEDAIVYDKETVLYKQSDYLGQKKTIHLFYDVNMRIEATALHPDGSEEELAVFELQDIDKIMEKEVMQKETTTKPKVSLSFELSRSNLFQLNAAKVNADETVLEEVVPEETDDSDKKKTSSKDDDVESEDKEVEDESETKSEDDASESKDEDASGEDDAEETAAKEPEYVEKIVPHSFDVNKIVENLPGLRLLSDDAKKAARKRIKELD